MRFPWSTHPYLPLQEGEAYLNLVTDACSRKIVGYHVHTDLTAFSVLQAYKQALKQRHDVGELIHHSDRGIQYCSKLYQALHVKYGVTCSMTDGYLAKRCFSWPVKSKIAFLIPQIVAPNAPGHNPYVDWLTRQSDAV